jgi:hypothetical protein
MIVTLGMARQHVMAALECNDTSRAETLMMEFEAVYPEAGAQLREEVAEAYA